MVYDALVAPEALRAARRGAALHFVGKRRGQPSTPQEEINALLVRLAGEGRRVLRLKGGDPNIFGRGGEEALALARAGVRVPGAARGDARPSGRWRARGSRRRGGG